MTASPLKGRQIQGGSNFRPICSYISERVLYRGIVTMEDEYKVVCALSNSAAFDDLESPRTPVSRSQYSLKANISQTVHLIHSMFRSRQGFWGSANEWCHFRFENIQAKMAADGHLGITALSCVTLAPAGLSRFTSCLCGRPCCVYREATTIFHACFLLCPINFLQHL